jgi:pSer/pThr/pTyr-binding forkhead associated (FHA) protein
MPEPQHATPRQITGDDIIAEILHNFELSFFPIRYTTLVPCLFHVYLHPEDYDQIRPVAPQVELEARRALEERMAELNRVAQPSIAERLKIKSRAAAQQTEYKALAAWVVEFHPDQEGQLGRGDMEVYSELGSAPREEFGVGAMTRRITRRSAEGATSTRLEAVPTPPQQGATDEAPSPPTTRAGEQTYGWLRYEDRSGPREYAITKDLVVIGRGGRSFWVDLKLDALPDISREHCRIRRDPATGRFFLKDVSQFGTTVNGSPVPSSMEVRDSKPHDKNIEVALPDRARIDLAGKLALTFEAAPGTETGGPPWR